MRRLKQFYLATTLLSLCLFAAPPTVAAFDIFPTCNTAGSGSAVCSDKQPAGGSNPVVDKIRGITNIVAWVGGAAAVIIIIISALKFVTSGSDISTGSRTDTDVEDARRALGGALIGLAIIVLARTLIVFVLDKL